MDALSAPDTAIAPDLGEFLQQHPQVRLGVLCLHAKESISRGLAQFPLRMRQIIEERAWEQRSAVNLNPASWERALHQPPIRLNSLYELITTPFPDGWGEDPDKIEALLKEERDAGVLAMYRQEMNAPLAKHGTNQHAIKEERGPAGSRSKYGSTSTAYLQARIQRDCPEQLDLIKDGVKSVAQVAREQGWVKPTIRLSLTGNPAEDAVRLHTKFGPDYMLALLEEI